MPDYVLEDLRKIILEYSKTKAIISKKHPLIITHFETKGGANEYTKNMVAFFSRKNPFPIFMNDFVIQFYESVEKLQYNDFYSINNEENFEMEVNLDEVEFRINVKTNQSRNEFIELIAVEDANKKLNFYVEDFKFCWNKLFHFDPSEAILNDFKNQVSFSNKNLYERYTEQNLIEIRNNFIYNKLLESEELQMAYYIFLSKL